MKTYLVSPGHSLTMSGGQEAKPGDRIELDDEAAQQFAHAIQEAPAQPESSEDPQA